MKKYIIKNIGVIVCLLVLAVGCFNFDFYLADCSSQYVDFVDSVAGDFPTCSRSDVDFHIVTRDSSGQDGELGSSGRVYGFNGDVSRVEIGVKRGGTYGTYVFYFTLFSDSGLIDFVYYYTLNYTNSANSYAFSDNAYSDISVDSAGYMVSGGIVYYCDSPSFDNVVLERIIPYSDVDIYPSESLQSDYGWPSVIRAKREPSYNSDIGYLQNITQKLIAVNNASGGVDLESARLKFTFDSLSTSGVDLTSGEYSVRVYQQVCYYKENLSEVFKEDYPLVEIGEFPILDNSVSFTVADAMVKVDNETDGILSSWDLFWNGCERSDNTYLQIIKKGSDGSEEYGGMVKLMYPASGGVFSSTYTPELAPDDGGYIGDNVQSGMGTGTNFDDAELNADDDIVNGSNSSDSLIGMVNGYISTLGAIPTMIGNMLSFLPQWCVDLISVSFGLLCVLIGFKFLRG